MHKKLFGMSEKTTHALLMIGVLAIVLGGGLALTSCGGSTGPACQTHNTSTAYFRNRGTVTQNFYLDNIFIATVLAGNTSSAFTVSAGIHSMKATTSEGSPTCASTNFSFPQCGSITVSCPIGAN